LIMRLLPNDAERREFGRRAREVVETNYSMNRVTEKYVDLYHRLLENPD